MQKAFFSDWITEINEQNVTSSGALKDNPVVLTDAAGAPTPVVERRSEAFLGLFMNLRSETITVGQSWFLLW